MSDVDLWPALPLDEWQDTYRTLHMWTQIVGKVRMALSPPLNHWWHVSLYVKTRVIDHRTDSVAVRRFRNPVRFFAG